MSFLSWLTGRQPLLAPPPIEPLAPAAVQKQDIVAETQARTFPNPFASLLGAWGGNTGIPVNDHSSLSTAAVYACVKIISEDIAGLDLQIRRRLASGGWRIITDHPLIRLFRRPNRWQTAWAFWTYILDCYCLRGNAYIFIVRDSNGAPIELVPIRPDSISPPIMSRGGMPIYLFSSDELGLYGHVANPDDIMHLRNSISLDGITGLSPIAAAQDVIGLALAAQQHGALLFQQGGQIAGVLQHPGKLSKEAAEHIAVSWRETHAGVRNAHKVAVLEEGMVFEKVAMTSEDAQLLECLARGTMITLANGVRIPVEEVKAGYPIMSWQNGEPVVAKVAAVGQPPRKPMVRIRTNRGRILTCTTDHPCLAQEVARSPSGRNGVNDEPHWVKAGDLAVDNFIRVALGHTAQDRNELSASEAWLLGFLVGDGYIRDGSCSLTTINEGVQNAAAAIIDSLGGELVAQPCLGNPANFNINTGGLGRSGSRIRELFNRADLVGRHSHDKRVPFIVQQDGPTTWAWFLSGYLDADGTVTHPGIRQAAVSYSSVNPELLADCQHLFASLGIQSAIYPYSPETTKMMPQGRISPARACWGLSINGRAMLARTAAVLQPHHSVKSRRLASFSNLTASRYGPFNWYYDRITEIELLGEGESFGLEISGTHTHVTNGLVTHNTRRFQVIDIASRIYRVPPHKLGELGRSTYGNIEQQQRSYIDDCLKSHTRQIEDLCNDRLLFDDERNAGFDVHYDFTSMLQGDENTRFQSAQIGLLNGFLNINEVRARENLNPIPGGDQYRVPLNTAPLGQDPNPLHPETIPQRPPPNAND